MAAHIDDIYDHEKEACIPAFLRETLHRLEQFRAMFLDCRRTGCFNRPNSELCVFDGEFFEVEGEQVLGTAICDLGGGSRKYLLAVFLNLLACDLSKFASYALVTGRAGG